MRGLLIIGMCLGAVCVNGQNFLRGSVNSRSISNIYPVVSGDGNTLIYMDNYTNDGSYQYRYSKKERGTWSAPNDFGVIRFPKATMTGAYTLSFDGSLLIFSMRGEGVGGFDLWWSQFNGERWSNPRNFGAPLNSTGNDCYPSISADGNFLYFTKCQTVTNGEGTDCSIWVAERNPTVQMNWRDPTMLPTSINGSGAKMPRIHIDNQTLYYFSGGDWQMSRKQNGTWGPGSTMSFLSENEGKEFLAPYYRPDRIITSHRNDLGNFNLSEVTVPPSFQPNNVVIKYGAVTGGSGAPMAADIRLVDYNSGEVVSFSRSDDATGEYIFILPEGQVYDFSVQPRRGNEIYHAEILDFQDLATSKRESQDFALEPMKDGAHMALGALAFDQNGSELDPRCDPEISRLTRLLSRNSGFNIEVSAYQDTVIYDTIPRPELTEVRVDSSYYYSYHLQPTAQDLAEVFSMLQTSEMDSLITSWNNSLGEVNNGNDTLLVNYLVGSFVGLDSTQHLVLTEVYHNDLTTKRAKTVQERLIQSGIPRSRITSIGHGDRRKPISAFREEAWETGVIEAVFFN